MERTLKSLTALFGASVVGIVLCFGMSVFTAVKDYQLKNAPVAPHPIATPAIAP